MGGCFLFDFLAGHSLLAFGFFSSGLGGICLGGTAFEAAAFLTTGFFTDDRQPG